MAREAGRTSIGEEGLPSARYPVSKTGGAQSPWGFDSLSFRLWRHGRVVRQRVAIAQSGCPPLRRFESCCLRPNARRARLSARAVGSILRTPRRFAPLRRATRRLRFPRELRRTHVLSVPVWSSWEDA